MPSAKTEAPALKSFLHPTQTTGYLRPKRLPRLGWRVYLQNEHGTSADAMHHMINMGLSKSARQGKHDPYAAMMVLERYFSLSGQGIELVLPKQLELQEKLRKGPAEVKDWF